MGGPVVSLGSSFKWSLLQFWEQEHVENLGWDSAAEG